MAVIPHFVAGGDPADIAQGLEPGKYMAQPSGSLGAVGVRYATAAAAPAEDHDYFQCRSGDVFLFYSGAAAGPTWCKSAADDDATRLTVARAKL